MRVMNPPHGLLRRQRPGFTLIELLVVITIIAVLASLIASAVFKVIDVQRQSASEQTITKVAGALKQQWEAVVTQAKQENIPPNVYSLAGGNPNRARVIWIKLRLKQEFPMTFQEALRPYNNNDDTANAYITAADLQSLYPNVPNIAPDIGAQSSACLALALSRKRSGVNLNLDDFGGAVTNSAYNDTTSGRAPLKQFVDDWKVPLAFYRWPTNHAEVDQLNPAKGGQASTFCDPQDPSGLLLDGRAVPQGGWLVTAQGQLTVQAQAFQTLCHPLIANPASPRTKWRSYYMVPVVASAGRNALLGLDPKDKSMKTVTPSDANDNLYSYRLRLGARGD